MPTRVKAIADAATLLFLRQGYAKTQISHIAQAVGVSVGTIYHDFAGKKEILHFILQCVLEPEFAERELERPITDALFPHIETDIMALFAQMETRFAAHLENGAAGYSLEALVSDTFDLLARYAVGCLFLEKNQFDFPALAAGYKASRRKLFDTTARYLSIFIRSGSLRPVEHPELVTTLIIETLTWWAMDQRYIAFEARDIPLGLAKEICMDNIIAAYKR